MTILVRISGETEGTDTFSSIEREEEEKRRNWKQTSLWLCRFEISQTKKERNRVSDMVRKYIIVFVGVRLENLLSDPSLLFQKLPKRTHDFDFPWMKLN